MAILFLKYVPFQPIEENSSISRNRFLSFHSLIAPRFSRTLRSILHRSPIHRCRTHNSLLRSIAITAKPQAYLSYWRVTQLCRCKNLAYSTKLKTLPESSSYYRLYYITTISFRIYIYIKPISTLRIYLSRWLFKFYSLIFFLSFLIIKNLRQKESIEIQIQKPSSNDISNEQSPSLTDGKAFVLEEAVRAHSLSCVQRIHTIDTPRAQQTKGWKPVEWKRAREKEKNDRQTILARLDNREDVAIRYYSGPRG